MFFRNVLWVGCIKGGFKNEQMAGTIKVHDLLFLQKGSLSSVPLRLNLEPWKTSSHWAFLGPTLCLFHP